MRNLEAVIQGVLEEMSKQVKANLLMKPTSESEFRQYHSNADALLSDVYEKLSIAIRKPLPREEPK